MRVILAGIAEFHIIADALTPVGRFRQQLASAESFCRACQSLTVTWFRESFTLNDDDQSNERGIERTFGPR